MSIRKNIATTGLALLMATTIPLANGSPLKLPFKLPFKLGTRDPPTALPEKATADDKKWQPAMDFDTDGCYNTPAIDANGNINPGLDHEDTGLASECRDASDLSNNNVYSRARCNNGWCAYLYDYYFEKDVALANVPFDPGHRNDWEHIAVFVKNGEAKVVAVSQHGNYETKNASEVRWDGTHPKTVYNKDGVGTHDFRFANADDDNIENHTGAWFYGALISYNGFPSTAIRDKLMSTDFGSANIAIKDASFQGQLEKARGDFVDGFDSGVDDGSPGNP
ncbi:secreted protein [Whalleya microplaca]|nr:secreted protein [Whalleya microplaca]